MTHLQFPVLASLALLGACSYEVTLFGGGGGDQPVFDATKVGDLVESFARDSVGEPTAVRCPPKMQFVPFDRYVCEVDVPGGTFAVQVRHRAHMAAVASWSEPTVGNERLARGLEALRAQNGHGEQQIECRGVVLTRTKPYGACKLDDGRDIDVFLLPEGNVMYSLEPNASAM